MGWGTWLKRGAMAAAGPVTGGTSWGMLAADIAGDVIGGVQQHRAAGRAADEQVASTEQASALQQPFNEAGAAQLGTMGQLAGVSGADIHKRALMDPSYDFRFQEGQRAMDRSAAARGTLLTGGHVKDTIRYGQNFASTEYGNAYNRAARAVDTQFSRASTMGQMGQRAAGVMGDLATGAGTARADEAIAKGDVWARGAGAVSDTFGALAAGRQGRGSTYGGGGRRTTAQTPLPSRNLGTGTPTDPYRGTYGR